MAFTLTRADNNTPICRSNDYQELRRIRQLYLNQGIVAHISGWSDFDPLMSQYFPPDLPENVWVDYQDRQREE